MVGNHRNYTKGVGLDRVKILLGKGIMTSEGELWKRQRYMMQPLFHRRVITEFAAMIAAENDRWVARWEQLAASGARVHGVKLAGHAGAPEELGAVTQANWYESVVDGFRGASYVLAGP